MIEHLSYERKEGDFSLQEVVKEYIPRKHIRNYYDMDYLKIVRTANCHKLVDSVIVGEDYRHHVYFIVITPNNKYYFSPWLDFPDTQEGLDDAERFAEYVMLEYNKNKNVHPKRWVHRLKTKV